ncbi:MAG TPA: hypothetical protein VI589_14730 [Vicinamibacteria bacterium]
MAGAEPSAFRRKFLILSANREYTLRACRCLGGTTWEFEIQWYSFVRERYLP